MKIAAFADLHARGKDLFAFKAQAAAALKKTRAMGIELCLLAGDINDNPNVCDSYAATGAVEWETLHFIDHLPGEKIAIVGNHDVSGVGSADGLSFLRRRRGITVVSAPEVIEIGSEVHVYCLPWDWSGNNALEAIKAMPKRYLEKAVLLAHVQVTGARMNAAKTCEADAGKWQISRADLAALPFDRVFFGDFHARQDLTEGRGGYIGAFRQLNHGESENPAGFEVWDSETGEVEWVELDAAPKYRTIRAADIDDPQNIMAGLDENLRVIFDAMPDPVTVKQLEAQGVTVEARLEKAERQQRADVPAGVVERPHELIDLWGRSQGLQFTHGRADAMHAMYDRMFADAKPAAEETTTTASDMFDTTDANGVPAPFAEEAAV